MLRNLEDLPATSQRPISSADRVGRDALALDAPIGAVHPLPVLLDQKGVFPDEQRLEPRLQIDLDRLGAPAAEGQGVAQPASVWMKVATMRWSANSRDMGRPQGRTRTALSMAVIFMA